MGTFILLSKVFLQRSFCLQYQLAAELASHSRLVNAVLFASSGDILCSGGSDGTIKVWKNLGNNKNADFPAKSHTNWEPYQSIDVQSGIMDMKLLEDKNRIVATTDEGQLCFVDFKRYSIFF